MKQKTVITAKDDTRSIKITVDLKSMNLTRNETTRKKIALQNGIWNALTMCNFDAHEIKIK